MKTKTLPLTDSPMQKCRVAHHPMNSRFELFSISGCLNREKRIAAHVASNACLLTRKQERTFKASGSQLPVDLPLDFLSCNCLDSAASYVVRSRISNFCKTRQGKLRSSNAGRTARMKYRVKLPKRLAPRIEAGSGNGSSARTQMLLGD